MADLRKSVSSLIDELFAHIGDNARRERHWNTGRTVGSLEQRYSHNDGVHIFEIWANKYIGALDTGSAPARRRGTDAEREKFLLELTAWCRAKGFPTGGLTAEGYARAAKWLKWYIGKYGSLVYRTPALQHKVIAPAVADFEHKLHAYLSVWYDADIQDIFTKKR